MLTAGDRRVQVITVCDRRYTGEGSIEIRRMLSAALQKTSQMFCFTNILYVAYLDNSTRAKVSTRRSHEVVDGAVHEPFSTDEDSNVSTPELHML